MIVSPILEGGDFVSPSSRDDFDTGVLGELYCQRADSAGSTENEQRLSGLDLRERQHLSRRLPNERDRSSYFRRDGSGSMSEARSVHQNELRVGAGFSRIAKHFIAHFEIRDAF